MRAASVHGQLVFSLDNSPPSRMIRYSRPFNNLMAHTLPPFVPPRPSGENAARRVAERRHLFSSPNHCTTVSVDQQKVPARVRLSLRPIRWTPVTPRPRSRLAVDDLILPDSSAPQSQPGYLRASRRFQVFDPLAGAWWVIGSARVETT